MTTKSNTCLKLEPFAIKDIMETAGETQMWCKD